MQQHTPLQILILCTGNSARSLLGEALLNHYAAGRWQAYSAGSQTKGIPHPLALSTLQSHGIETHNLRSKSWDEFASAHAPNLDVVITVCDNAANEMCPIWQGTPMKVHWGIADPAAVSGTEVDQRAAFEQAFAILNRRVQALCSVAINRHDPVDLKLVLDELAKVN